jgi:hypothetical protein
MSKTQIVTGGIADDAVSEEHLDATAITGTTALAETPASTDELLISDGGTLKRLDFTHIFNAPAFHVYLNSNQTIGTSSWTKITWDQEFLDSGGNFASNKFTVPSDGAGTYMFGYGVRTQNIDDGEQASVKLYKNGSAVDTERALGMQYSPGTNKGMSVQASYVDTLAATDYIEVYTYHNEGGDQVIETGGSFFYGYKLVGV